MYFTTHFHAMGNQQSNTASTGAMASRSPFGNDDDDKSYLTLTGYDIMKPLGEGSYGKVRIVRQKKNGKYYALKYVDKRHCKYFVLQLKQYWYPVPYNTG